MFTKIAVKRPVTTTMLIFIVIAFGILSITNLKLDMLPNMNIPVAIVSTTYSGTGPAEIEKLITTPIEGAVGTVAGIDEISSTSSYGQSTVVAIFNNDVDIDAAALDMREKVDMVKGALPDGADAPMILKIDVATMNSIQLSITSEDTNLVELRRIVDDKITNRIERQDGVASVSVYGGREKEIEVKLIADKVRGYGITEQSIQQSLAAENRQIPTGSVKQGDKNLSMRVSGEFKSIEQIKDLPVTTPTGSVIRLSDVADINEVFSENTDASYINGVSSVNMVIQKQSTANSVLLSANVKKEISRIQKEMPGVKFTMLIDPADFINRAIGQVTNSALLGGIFAILILYIFLRNVRSTLIVGVAIPISVISTFVLMYYADISINIMSLGGLTLGIGMLVDNSIVVLESIYRKIEEGEDKFDAAIDGAKEVAMSVTASTLTTIAVFLPITFAGGVTAQIFNQLALTIAFSLISSLVVSLSFVPMACSLLLKPNVVHGEFVHKNIITKFIDLFGHLISFIEKVYKRLLSAALNHRVITFIITILFVVATFATLPMGLIGMEFMPETDEGIISINISMPKGTIVSETEKTADQVLRAIENDPNIDSVATIVGQGGGMGFGSSSDVATVYVILKPKEERKASAAEISTEMDKMMQEIPGAKINVSAMAMSMGSFGGGGLQLTIKGENLQTLTQMSREIASIIEGVDGVRNVETSVQEVSPQATIVLNRDKASSYGITSASVAATVNTAVTGVVATKYKVEANELNVRIIQDKENFNYINDVQNLLIPSPKGVNVPLYEIADIVLEDLPTSISRLNQQKYVTVSATADKDLKSITTDIEAKLANYVVPDNYTWEFTGSSEQMNETFADLGLALIMALLIVYMIMAAEFESFIYPLIVMFSIPIALTGGIFGLFVMRQSLSITAFLGLIMLAGVVINNAIVLVDYTNLLVRERQLSVKDALLQAGPIRLRPILMTTLTTVLALIPMMVATGSGSELMSGLATVVVFGLTLSTLVTLLFIPVIYLSYNSLKNKMKKKKVQ